MWVSLNVHGGGSRSDFRGLYVGNVTVWRVCLRRTWVGPIRVSKGECGEAGTMGHQKHLLRTGVWFLVLTSGGPQLPVTPVTGI